MKGREKTAGPGPDSDWMGKLVAWPLASGWLGCWERLRRKLPQESFHTFWCISLRGCVLATSLLGLIWTPGNWWRERPDEVEIERLIIACQCHDRGCRIAFAWRALSCEPLRPHRGAADFVGLEWEAIAEPWVISYSRTQLTLRSWS